MVHTELQRELDLAAVLSRVVDEVAMSPASSFLHTLLDI